MFTQVFVSVYDNDENLIRTVEWVPLARDYLPRANIKEELDTDVEDDGPAPGPNPNPPDEAS